MVEFALAIICVIMLYSIYLLVFLAVLNEPPKQLLQEGHNTQQGLLKKYCYIWYWFNFRTSQFF